VKRTVRLIVLVSLAGCSSSERGATRAKQESAAEKDVITESAEEDGLRLTLVTPGQLTAGTTATAVVVLRNCSDRPLVVPAVPFWRGHPRPELTLLCGNAAEASGGRITIPLHLYEDRVTGLNPGEELTYTDKVLPGISGPARYCVEFHNKLNEVLVEKMVVDKTRFDGLTVRRVAHVPKVIGNLWKGWLCVDVPVKVSPHSSSTVEEKMKPLRRPAVDTAARLVALSSVIRSPSELSAAVLSQYGKEMHHSDPLRALCYGSLASLALEGVALAYIPTLLAQAQDDGNAPELRVVMIECLGELLREPARRSDIGLNCIEAEVDAKSQDMILRTLADILINSEGAVARAAKAAIDKRQARNASK